MFESGFSAHVHKAQAPSVPVVEALVACVGSPSCRGVHITSSILMKAGTNGSVANIVKSCVKFPSSNLGFDGSRLVPIIQIAIHPNVSIKFLDYILDVVRAQKRSYLMLSIAIRLLNKLLTNFKRIIAIYFIEMYVSKNYRNIELHLEHPTERDRKVS